MKNYLVTFTTYEEYNIQAENKSEAIRLAIKKLESDRCMNLADTHYDEVEVEENNNIEEMDIL